MWNATIGQDGNFLANLSKPQLQPQRHGLQLVGLSPFNLTHNLGVLFLRPPGQRVVSSQNTRPLGRRAPSQTSRPGLALKSPGRPSPRDPTNQTLNNTTKPHAQPPSSQHIGSPTSGPSARKPQPTNGNTHPARQMKLKCTCFALAHNIFLGNRFVPVNVFQKNILYKSKCRTAFKRMPGTPLTSADLHPANTSSPM